MFATAEVGGLRTAQIPYLKVRFLEDFAEHHGTNTLRIAASEHVPRSTTRQVPCEQLLYSSHLLRVQCLPPQAELSVTSAGTCWQFPFFL